MFSGQVASFLVAQVRKLNDNSSRRPQLCDGGLKTWLRRIHADRDKSGDRPEAVSAPPQLPSRRMEKAARSGERAPGAFASSRHSLPGGQERRCQLRPLGGAPTPPLRARSWCLRNHDWEMTGLRKEETYVMWGLLEAISPAPFLGILLCA